MELKDRIVVVTGAAAGIGQAVCQHLLELGAIVGGIDYRVDVNTLEQEVVGTLKMNDIARVNFKVQQPLICDGYDRNHATGSFILIDETNNNTVAAGMISS